ncbi:hypothetical protein LCGC14_3131820, partial [marine sediment metagenome]
MTTGKGLKTVIIIPARMESKRLPGKPLANVNGKPLLQWTYNAAKKTEADFVIVTTPDKVIVDYCFANDILVALTDENIENGTVRCAQAMKQSFSDKDMFQSISLHPLGLLSRVVNWQVDEPLVDPTYVNRMLKSQSSNIQTLVSPYSPNVFSNGTVRAVINDKGTICHWFTRHSIPGTLFHCGIYAFAWTILEEIADLQPTKKAKLESLEQLTWLENEYPISPI